MATVTLYLYQDDSHQGEGLTLSSTSTYSKSTDVVEPQKPVIDDTTNQKTEVTITHRTTYLFTLTLTKVEYWKRIYDHCEIHANIQVGNVQKKLSTITDTVVKDKDNKAVNTTTDTVDGTTTDVNLPGDSINKYFQGACARLVINDHAVAENYKVFNALTRYKTVSSGTSKFLELTIFSADKLMDLDKYSRAYTAKRLYTDILTEESKKFVLNQMNLPEVKDYLALVKDYKKDSSSSTKPTMDPDKLYKEVATMNDYISNQMQLLKYEKSETKDNKTTVWMERDELRIPYIVQYNETFYQFLVRAANRFGEFLYFEDGKLHLGMQPSEGNYKDSSSEVIDWADGANGVQSRHYESVLSESIEVEDLAYNYVNHTENDDNSQLYASSSDSRYNPDPVATDEWTTQKLEKGEYLEYNEILGEEMKASIPEVIFKALEASTLSEVMVGVVKGFFKKLIEVSQSTNDFNRVANLAYYQDDDDNYLMFDDQREGEEFTQFATFNGSDNLSNNLSKLFKQSNITNFIELFYSIIRQKEKEIGEQAVWLDFGSNYKPIKLGDKLHVDGTDYVATYVEGSYEGSQEHLLVSAIPVMDLGSSTAGDTPDGKEAWNGVIPIPPALPDVIIREAKPQVAFVTETLDPELMGRIRVRYPWQDSKGDATPWIRVTLPMATKGGAVNFTPSVGDEVMVGYVHGNIDHPYGMGYLTSPFVNKKWSNALPLDQYGCAHGIKTKTGHHLTFEDGFALVPMLMNTMGFLSVFKSFWPTGQWGPWPLGYESTADLGGGFELSDRYGFYKITGSTDERSVTIESPAGTVEVNAFQGITISAPNGEVNIKGKNVNISANNRLTLSSGGNIKDKLAYQKKWSESKGKAFGLAVLTDLKGGLEPLKEMVTNVTDLSFVRCVLECLFHPVNGTLQIKSYTFVTIEAGDGKAEVPPTKLRKDKTNKPSKPSTVSRSVELINTNVCALIDNLKSHYDKLLEATKEFNDISGAEGINMNQTAISYKDVVTSKDPLKEDNLTLQNHTGNNLQDEEVKFTKECPKAGDYLNPFSYKFAKEKWEQEEKSFLEDAQERNKERATNRSRVIAISEKLRKAAVDLSDAANKWTDIKNNFNTSHYDKEEFKVSDMANAISEEELVGQTGIISLSKMKDRDYDNTIAKPNDNAWDNQKKAISRYAIYKYLKGVDDYVVDNNAFTNANSTLNNEKWKEFINSVKEKEGGFGDELKDELKDWLKEEVSPYSGFVNDHLQWKLGFKGQILMSDQSEKTASFDKNHHLVSSNNIDEASVKAIKEILNKV